MSKCNCPKCNFTGATNDAKSLSTVDITTHLDTPTSDYVTLDTKMVSTASEPAGDDELQQLLQIVSESGKIAQTAADAATSYMRNHGGDLTYDEQLLYYPLSVLAWAYQSYAAAKADSTVCRREEQQFRYLQDRATLAYNIQSLTVRLLGAIDDARHHRLDPDVETTLASVRAMLKHVIDIQLSKRL